MPPAAFTIY